jgi:hypothetical protein
MEQIVNLGTVVLGGCSELVIEGQNRDSNGTLVEFTYQQITNRGKGRVTERVRPLS